MPGRGFLFGLLLSLGLGLGLQTLMLLVDPGAAWRQRWPGKPQWCTPGLRVAADPARLVGLQGARPLEALLGSSRVQAAFARRDAEAVLQTPVLNLGVPGADVAYMEAQLAAALRAGTLRRIWVGVDYGMFASVGRAAPPADTARSPWSVALGAPALKATLGALLDADDCQHPARDLRGFEAPTRRAQAVARFGWRAAFALSRQQLATQFGRAAARESALAQALAERQWAALAQLLARAREHDVAVVLLVGPSHREYAALIEAAGLGAGLRGWRRRLRDVAYAQGVPLFDWSERLHGEGFERECERGGAGCAFYDVNHVTPWVGAELLEEMQASLAAREDEPSSPQSSPALPGVHRTASLRLASGPRHP